MTFLNSHTCVKVEISPNKVNKVWKKFLNRREIRGSSDWSWIPWWEPWVPRGFCPSSFVTSTSSSENFYFRRFTTTSKGFIAFKGSTFASIRGALPPSRGALPLGGLLPPLRGLLPSKFPPSPLKGHPCR